jgi:hypothetical protein
VNKVIGPGQDSAERLGPRSPGEVRVEPRRSVAGRSALDAAADADPLRDVRGSATSLRRQVSGRAKSLGPQWCRGRVGR